MIVTVHEKLWLLECVVHEALENTVEHGVLLRIQIKPEMPAAKPVAEELHFETQQRLVIKRQTVRRRTGLECPQGMQGISIEPRCGILIEPVEILDISEVLEQQKTLIEIPGMDVRYMHAG